MIAEEGGNFALAPWDWRYYAEKLRKAQYDLDEAEIKPYFQLDKMIAAAFETARRLFGLTFTPTDVPLYHPDARAWEVKDAEGRHVGLFIGDYFARGSKHSGAWMTLLRDQEKLIGDVRPIILNVCNFSKPAAGEPALLSFDDARTLFHEFGHGLHGLMSNVTYPLLAGTSVPSDFVELPSQLYEHWLEVPEILQKYALHAHTGQPMPTALLERLLATRTFNQAFAIVEYTASALVDLDIGAGHARHRRLRTQGARRHSDAGRDRDAAPSAAFPASVFRRRLCRGLLFLSVVGSARRRRFRGLRRDRQCLRPGHRQALARFHLQRRQSARCGRGL
jgi:peptidyl-dipeptidase Dcp